MCDAFDVFDEFADDDDFDQAILSDALFSEVSANLAEKRTLHVMANDNNEFESNKRPKFTTSSELRSSVSSLSTSSSAFVYKHSRPTSSSAANHGSHNHRTLAQNSGSNSLILHREAQKKGREENRSSRGTDNAEFNSMNPGQSSPGHATWTATNHRMRRKFPGPAGVLPKLDLELVKRSSMLQVSPVIGGQEAATSHEADILSRIELPSSQLLMEDTFRQEPWMTMKRHLETKISDDPSLRFLRKLNIAWVQKQANRKRLMKHKVPLLGVVLHSVTYKGQDVIAVFRDETGKISGSISRDLIEAHASAIQPGCIFLLRQVGIFSPTSTKHYLNVTTNNAAHLYHEDGSGKAVHLNLSGVSWDIFFAQVKDVIASPPSSNEGSPQYPASRVVRDQQQVVSSKSSTSSGDTRSLIQRLKCSVQLPEVVQWASSSSSAAAAVANTSVSPSAVPASAPCGTKRFSFHRREMDSNSTPLPPPVEKSEIDDLFMDDDLDILMQDMDF